MGNLYKIYQLNRNKPYLIFDLGFYNGDSSEYYLQNNCKVIGVECNPHLVKYNEEKFKHYIPNNLILINNAISDVDNQIIPFFLSKYPVWSSTHRQIAERVEKAEEIEVKTITLKSLIEKYGCPDYCKIDIEGNDVIAVRSLIGLDTKPKVISVEAECLGVGEHSTINMLDELYNVGYRHFFIVDQRRFESFRFDFHRRYNWLDYDDVCKQFEELKKQKFEYGVWADIYATF